jgi:bacterioferritin
MAMQSNEQPMARPMGSGSQNNPGDNGLIWQDRFSTWGKDAETRPEQGAVTENYKANREQIVALLKRAQASEWSSFLQYWHHYFMASDIHAREVQSVFKEHAEDEFEHARRFGERIQQLNGVPCDSPDEIQRLSPTPTEYNHDLRSMMLADLIGERETLDFYDECIRTCGFDDNVTRAIFEHVIREEAEHANDFATLLYAFDGTNGQQIQSIHDELVQLARGSSNRPQQQTRSA